MYLHAEVSIQEAQHFASQLFSHSLSQPAVQPTQSSSRGVVECANEAKAKSLIYLKI